ncbi:MAG: galactokinase [Pygmaiobacter massiliensis]|nr:galactokinase [Pygmaiobacter massiliensis]
MYTTKAYCEQIAAGRFDRAFAALYNADQAGVEKQRQRYIEAIQEFAQLYGADRQVQIYSAPGRTEIGGNHTDHNNGIVMAAAVNLDIIAVVSQNQDGIIRVKSKGFSRADEVDLAQLDPQPQEEGRSAALIRGVAARICQLGGKVGGFDAYTTSDVLRGSGLSSSAAFEVVVGAVMNGEFNQDRFTPIQIAQMSQYAENVFFGKPSGLMDQMASSVGSAITIDFENPEAPVVTPVAFDLASYGLALCITDTKGSHADLTDDYAAIRSEMEQVAGFFGKKVLRQVQETELYENLGRVRKALGDRAVLRAIHFFADSRRALALRDAVKQGDIEQFKQLIIEGGHSSFEYNQNAYSIKHPAEQGVSLGVAISQHILQGSGAWRLQGGGFAGTIQAFVPKEKLSAYIAAMENAFGEGCCYVLSVRNFGAVRIEENL